MAYKINGTTVVDNSRNVCACCVTSCCITASDRLDAPSGNTASRPSSPATGSLYFDTDEGSLVSYNGTEWSAVGGGVSPDTLTPVTDWIGPFFCCCTGTTSVCGCQADNLCFTMNPYTCQVFLADTKCNSNVCGWFKWFTFNPSTCTVSFDCCSCPACRGSNGHFLYPKYNCCFWCARSVFRLSTNTGFMFRTKSIFRHQNGCDPNCFAVVTTDAACSVCICCLGCGTYQCCCGPIHNLCVGADMSNCRIFMTPDACCAVQTLATNSLCLCCCAGTAQTFTTPSVVFWQGPIVGSSGYESYNHHPITNPKSGLLDYYCGSGLGFSFFKPMAVFCNGVLLHSSLTGTCVKQAIVFLCNNGTTVPIMQCCPNGDTRSFFETCENSSTYPTSVNFNGFFRLNKDYVGFEFWGCRCCTRVYWGFMKHSEGTTCFDVTANCHSINMVRKTVSSSTATSGNAAGRCAMGHYLPGCGTIGSFYGESLFDYANQVNSLAKFIIACNSCTLCTFLCPNNQNGILPIKEITACCCRFVNMGCNNTWYPSGATSGYGVPPVAYSLEYKLNTLDAATQSGTLPGKIPSKTLSDGACFGKCYEAYGPICCYEGATDTICTCHMSLYRVEPRRPTQDDKFYLVVSCMCHQCCEPPSTTLICQEGLYVRIYCG